MDRELQALLHGPNSDRPIRARHTAARTRVTRGRSRAPRRLRDRVLVRPSWLFLALVAVTVGCGVLAYRAVPGSGGATAGVFGFVVASWLVTLCLHEFAHAYVGYRAGDESVVVAGYLTLNPLRYGHPVLSLLLPLLALAWGGIGLPGGAVQLHRHRFRSRGWDSAVSAAGPGVNLVVAAIAITASHGVHDDPAHFVFWSAVAFAGWLQLSVTVLNLLPVPGLDGWGMVEPFCSPATQAAAAKVKPFGLLLLFGLLSVGTAGAWFTRLVAELAAHLGLPAWLWLTGAQLFQFWRS